jgi:hypothetical protein
MMSGFLLPICAIVGVRAVSEIVDGVCFEAFCIFCIFCIGCYVIYFFTIFYLYCFLYISSIFIIKALY